MMSVSTLFWVVVVFSLGFFFGLYTAGAPWPKAERAIARAKKKENQYFESIVLDFMKMGLAHDQAREMAALRWRNEQRALRAEVEKQLKEEQVL